VRTPSSCRAPQHPWRGRVGVRSARRSPIAAGVGRWRDAGWGGVGLAVPGQNWSASPIRSRGASGVGTGVREVGPGRQSRPGVAMNASESQQNLLSSAKGSQQSLTAPAEYILGPVEKHFLLSAERGDCATVRRLLEENQDHPEILNIDCVDPLNRTALIAAIENENIDLILLLLELGIQVKVGRPRPRTPPGSLRGALVRSRMRCSTPSRRSTSRPWRYSSSRRRRYTSRANLT
jgi:hypothetical protein